MLTFSGLRVVRVDADGYVQITDRIKDVIKTGGEWLSSLELEDIVSRHPDVAEVALRCGQTLGLGLYGLPSFWIAGLLILVFAAGLGWLPASHMHSVGAGELSAAGRLVDLLRHLVLPAASLGLVGAAATARLLRSTLLEAPECFVTDARAGSRPKVLARLSGHEKADYAVVENLRAASTDGAPIQFFLVRPKNARGPLPLLLWIHGGPIGMDTDGWHWRWNPLLAVAAGYAVALPNPRGSTGFGQQFIQGIWGNVWGAQCYDDLMAVTDALVARPDVDGARTMAMGGSFGGYMTNWVGTQTDRFKCLVTHASIVTMAQFTGTTDHPAWWYLEMGGEDPYADMAKFDRYAPIRHIKNWKTPVLIIHGELDYRCPINEGLNLFEALQYHGVPSELLVFPDENHWILKPRNAVAWYEAVLEFIGRHLKQ